MAFQSNMNSRRWLLFRVGVALIVATCGLAGQAFAQDPGAHDRIYVVTHVDIVPPNTVTGTKLVQQYVADSRKDKGIVEIEASAQISRLNHISIVEVWQNQKAFDEHVAAAHTRQFRQQIDPMLGSPYDERLHQLLQ
jgi:quinol monooxygenase YgiN